jgi:hypothetical protein
MGQHSEVVRHLRRIVPKFNCWPVGRRYHSEESHASVN